MVFTTRTVYSKVKDSKASVQEKDYFCHCLKGKDGLGAVIIADGEYKQMLAFGLMQDLVTKFKRKFDMRTPGVRSKCSKDHQFDEAFPELAKLLVDCQDPTKVDKVLKIHSQIDQTKAVMYKTIDSLLDRGCKLDDLVNRSDDLTARSKVFYDTAKSTNSCCIVS
jgi:synaptobrevin homolog YKT6